MLQEVYHDIEATRCVRDEQRAQEIWKYLERVRQTIFESSERLIKHLTKEFEKTREVLRSGFGALEEQMATMNRSLSIVNESLQQVNNQLYAINENVIQIARGVQDVNQSIQENNRLTAKLINVVHSDWRWR